MTPKASTNTRTTAILFFVAAVLFFIVYLINQSAVFVALSVVELCLGLVFLNKGKKNAP